MGSPSYPQPSTPEPSVPKFGDRYWNSGGLIQPPDPSTVETPEERYERTYGSSSLDYSNPYTLRMSILNRQRHNRSDIMSQYQREYEAALRGGTPDAELGSGMTSVQFE